MCLRHSNMITGSNYSIRRNPVLEVYINGVPVDEAHEARLLCVILHSTLSWTEHTNKMDAKLGNGISMV